jgi:hypothetical protein
MPVNAYIQKTVDTTSISERSIRRIRKEKSDTGIRKGARKYRALKVFLRGISTILNFFF